MNRYGSTYIYYHCTHANHACREGSIEERELERQVISFFEEQDGPTQVPLNQESLRYLLATRARSVTLQNKLLRIDVKEPR